MRGSIRPAAGKAGGQGACNAPLAKYCDSNFGYRCILLQRYGEGLQNRKGKGKHYRYRKDSKASHNIVDGVSEKHTGKTVKPAIGWWAALLKRKHDLP